MISGMASSSETSPTKFTISNAPFYTNCSCCRKNFESLKLTLLRTAAKVQGTGDKIMVYSRPETLQCADCEGLKKRYCELLASMYEIHKDQEGFINLKCTPMAGMYLLKSTAVMNHLIPVEFQTNIKLRF